MSVPPEPTLFTEARAQLDGLFRRAASDPEFRRLCIADGRAAIKAALDVDLPEEVTVTFVDHIGAGPGIVLPPLRVLREDEPAAATPAPATPPAADQPAAEAPAPRPSRPLNLNALRPKQD